MPQALWTTQQQVEIQQEEGEQPTTPPATPTGDAPVNPAPATPPASGEEKKFTQADVEKAVEERLKRERESAKNKKAQEDAEAERNRLAESQQFKELSEKQGIDLKAANEKVTGLETELAQYRGLFEKQLAEQKAALPAPVVALLDKMPLIEQSEWIAKNAAELGVQPKGVPASPRGNGSGTGSALDNFIAQQNGAK